MLPLEAHARQLSAEAVDNPALIDTAVEVWQRWIEYLDELELSDLTVDESVTVRTAGMTIKFPSIDEVTEWITSNK